jgi:hypothetical protein
MPLQALQNQLRAISARDIHTCINDRAGAEGLLAPEAVLVAAEGGLGLERPLRLVGVTRPCSAASCRITSRPGR